MSFKLFLQILPFCLQKLCTKISCFLKPQGQGLVSLRGTNLIRVEKWLSLASAKLGYEITLKERERMMPDLNVIILPWFLFAIEQAAFLKIRYSVVGSFPHKGSVIAGLALNPGLFLVTLTIKDISCQRCFPGQWTLHSLSSYPDLGSQMCFRIPHILDRQCYACSECFLYPLWSMENYCFNISAAGLWNFHSKWG